MTSRVSSIDDLATVLSAEERVYRELRELLQEEREHMARLDAEALAQAVDAKEMLAAEARFLEQSRLAIARSLAGQIGVDAEAPSLSALCAALGPEGARLREWQGRLVSLINAVKELVDANASFAGDSLGQVRGTLRLLGRLLPAEPLYGPGPRDERAGALGAGRRVRECA